MKLRPDRRISTCAAPLLAAVLIAGCNENFDVGGTVVDSLKTSQTCPFTEGQMYALETRDAVGEWERRGEMMVHANTEVRESASGNYAVAECKPVHLSVLNAAAADTDRDALQNSMDQLLNVAELRYYRLSSGRMLATRVDPFNQQEAEAGARAAAAELNIPYQAPAQPTGGAMIASLGNGRTITFDGGCHGTSENDFEQRVLPRLQRLGLRAPLGPEEDANRGDCGDALSPATFGALMSSGLMDFDGAVRFVPVDEG